MHVARFRASKRREREKEQRTIDALRRQALSSAPFRSITLTPVCPAANQPSGLQLFSLLCSCASTPLRCGAAYSVTGLSVSQRRWFASLFPPNEKRNRCRVYTPRSSAFHFERSPSRPSHPDPELVIMSITRCRLLR